MSRIGEVAARLDAGLAQTACARVLAALGGCEQWSPDHLDAVADALRPVHAGTGLPSFCDQDEAAVAFWERCL